MTLISSSRGMALEIVQRSEALNDAWQNLELHYRAKGTSEILRVSHEVNGETMEPGEDPFQFLMEIDRSVADLHRLGDRSVTELRLYVIIESSLLLTEISGSWRTSVIKSVKVKTRIFLGKLFSSSLPSCRQRVMLFALLVYSKRWLQTLSPLWNHVSDDYFAIVPPETPTGLRSSL